MKKISLALFAAMLIAPVVAKADPMNKNVTNTNTPAANGSEANGQTPENNKVRNNDNAATDSTITNDPHGKTMDMPKKHSKKHKKHDTSNEVK